MVQNSQGQPPKGCIKPGKTYLPTGEFAGFLNHQFSLSAFCDKTLEKNTFWSSEKLRVAGCFQAQLVPGFSCPRLRGWKRPPKVAQLNLLWYMWPRRVTQPVCWSSWPGGFHVFDFFPGWDVNQIKTMGWLDVLGIIFFCKFVFGGSWWGWKSPVNMVLIGGEKKD